LQLAHFAIGTFFIVLPFRNDATTHIYAATIDSEGTFSGNEHVQSNYHQSTLTIFQIKQEPPVVKKAFVSNIGSFVLVGGGSSASGSSASGSSASGERYGMYPTSAYLDRSSR
jgi:hypothetical protein